MIAWADNLQLQHKVHFVHRVKDTNTPKPQSRQQKGCQKNAKGCRVVLHKAVQKGTLKRKGVYVRCPLSVFRCKGTLFYLGNILRHSPFHGIIEAEVEEQLSMPSFSMSDVRPPLESLCWFLFLPSSAIRTATSLEVMSIWMCGGGMVSVCLV